MDLLEFHMLQRLGYGVPLLAVLLAGNLCGQGEVNDTDPVQQARPSGRDRASDALRRAQQLADEGKFEEALEQHVWYHTHAVELDEAHYGVRLSFALHSWVELGKKYPKATESLRAIRNSRTSQLLAGKGNREIFDEVRAINEHLQENQATVDLYRKIDQTDSKLARETYDLAEPALVQAKEFVLAKKHLGESQHRFDKIRTEFERGLEAAKSISSADAIKAVEAIFTNSVVRLITILDGTGDRTGARAIQAKAIKVLDRAPIREALGPQARP